MSRSGKITLSAALMLGLSFCEGSALADRINDYAQLETPPGRETPALTPNEVSKLKKDLAGQRDRQNARVKPRELEPAPKSQTPR